MRLHRNRFALIVVGAVLAMAGSAACGGGDGDDASDGASAATATQPAASARPTEPAAATPSNLALVGKNLQFDLDRMRAAPGAVTIEFDNQDGGVPHNLHVFNGSDASGASIGQTELESGPVKQTLQLELESGEYFYVCDAHPTTMTGTIDVG